MLRQRSPDSANIVAGEFRGHSIMRHGTTPAISRLFHRSFFALYHAKVRRNALSSRLANPPAPGCSSPSEPGLTMLAVSTFLSRIQSYSRIGGDGFFGLRTA